VARAIVHGASVVGVMAGLDGDGALLLRTPDGEVHRVRSGDVEAITPMAPVPTEPDERPAPTSC